jgi:hypothetical protein
MASVVHVRNFRPWQPTRGVSQGSEVTFRYNFDKMVERRMRLWREAHEEMGIKITKKAEREMLAEVQADISAFIASKEG